MTAAQEHRHFKHLPACPLCKERIAALESELAATKAKEETSFVSYKTQKARAEKAEAELAEWKELYPGTELKARAEKAEAEVERLKEFVSYLNHLRKEYPEAEWRIDFLLDRLIERGGRESGTPGGGTSPSGVSPSPPDDDTNAALELARVLSEQGIESVLTPRFKLNGKPVTVAAAEPAAPCYCDCYALPGESHEPDCPAARKEAK